MASSTPSRSTHTRIVSVMPTGIIPRVMGHMPTELPTIIMIAPMKSPMIAVVGIPMITPRAPSQRIVHIIVPIVPVARCGNHISIHTIIIDIPLPTGPKCTTIHYIPIERTAHWNSIARIAETDDAHSILVVRVAAFETIHPTLVIVHTCKLLRFCVLQHCIIFYS